MDVKQAVVRAKEYVLDLFQDERPVNVGLEEVEFENHANEWVVTIGFSRPWDEPKNAVAVIAAGPPRRSYKVLRLSNTTGDVLSVRNHEVQN